MNIVLREGEKHRPLVVRLASTAPPKTPSKPPPSPAPPAEHSTHPLAYGLGGLGALAAVSWAYFGARGLSERSDCKDRQPCAAEVNDLLLAADISLLVSLASFAAGTYFFLATPDDARATAAASGRSSVLLGPSLRRSGGGITVGTAF
jgi:hypothetical protein